MKEFVYTILDDFEVVHYGNISAESAADAKKNTEERYGNGIPVEIWHSSKTVLKKKSSLPAFDMYYLRKSNTNELVYAGPRIGLLQRSFFLLLIIGFIFIEGSILWSLFFVLIFLLTFFRSLKIMVRHESILYRKKFFWKIKEKHLDISNATKVIFKGINFESDTSSSKCYFFVCLEKDGQEIIVHGSHDNNMQSLMKMAKRIGSFLELPIA